MVYFVITVSPFYLSLNPLYSKCLPFIYKIVLPLILTYIIYLLLAQEYQNLKYNRINMIVSKKNSKKNIFLSKYVWLVLMKYVHIYGKCCLGDWCNQRPLVRYLYIEISCISLSALAFCLEVIVKCICFVLFFYKVHLLNICV